MLLRLDRQVCGSNSADRQRSDESINSESEASEGDLLEILEGSARKLKFRKGEGTKVVVKPRGPPQSTL